MKKLLGIVVMGLFKSYPIDYGRTCTRPVPKEIKLIFCCVFNNLKHNIHVNINE